MESRQYISYIYFLLDIPFISTILKDFTGADDDLQVLLLVAKSGEKPDLVELAEILPDYKYYFCDMADLDKNWGVSSFPTVIGIGSDGGVRFTASAFGNFLDGDYFRIHL